MNEFHAPLYSPTYDVQIFLINPNDMLDMMGVDNKRESIVVGVVE